MSKFFGITSPIKTPTKASPLSKKDYSGAYDGISEAPINTKVVKPVFKKAPVALGKK